MLFTIRNLEYKIPKDIKFQFPNLVASMFESILHFGKRLVIAGDTLGMYNDN